jgi:ubiquinone/menaquinone biosynthesis C-methylase UbiE
MLAVAQAHLLPHYAKRVTLSVADARSLPVPDGWAEAGVAGWVFGHFTEWSAATWRQEIGRAVGELERAVRPEGRVIILETLGTGTIDPGPPTAFLATYYDWLEQEFGFTRLVIRTDYEFASVPEAVTHMRFFFGDELASLIRREDLRVVPEWTGIWSKRGTLTGTSRVKHPTRA